MVTKKKINPEKCFFLLLFTLILLTPQAMADRLKDMTSIAGVRTNQLVGYGLVVGLAGTGDGNASLTQQAMQSMISQFGVVTNAANINGKNAASVIVTAELPPFIKPGQKLDIVVSTAGQAKSLRGGTLLHIGILTPNDESFENKFSGLLSFINISGLFHKKINFGNFFFESTISATPEPKLISFEFKAVICFRP